jgi:fimbrial chaperone protein
MRTFIASVAWFSALLFCAITQAASFEVAVSPSRFEVSAKPAQRVGQSLLVYNLGATATDINVRTLDWTYSPDGSIGYVDELLPNSCRPWVTLERKTVRVTPRGQANFRFQIDVPAAAPRTECRFMLALEGVEPAHQAVIQSGGASLNLPVNGRIAVAVYVLVGGAEPVLEVVQVGVKDIAGVRTPVITVTNKGDAHGRLDGSLDAVDAKGVKHELLPEGTPVMPGQTRTLPFKYRTDIDKKPADFAFPLKTRGILDWERGSFKVEMELK